MSTKARSLFDSSIVIPALLDSVKKLNPAVMIKNPVMFVTMVGAAVTTAEIFISSEPKAFTVQISIWLWFTVLFANFAEAMAEGRGKAQANALRQSRSTTLATRLGPDGARYQVDANALRKGDIIVVAAGELIASDGDIIEGAATVDESAITGESAPVIREAGGDRSSVTGGTRVLSDVIKIRISADPGHSFLDRMIGLVEGAKRQKTPNEIALTILLAALTVIFLIVCVTLMPFGIYSQVAFSITVLVALLVCLIPTTIGGLLSAIGIAGIDRTEKCPGHERARRGGGRRCRCPPP
jgi:K+-transporting ATPase ATPase B chain